MLLINSVYAPAASALLRSSLQAILLKSFSTLKPKLSRQMKWAPEKLLPLARRCQNRYN